MSKVRIDRVPPQNMDAERAVLGAMLIPETGRQTIAKVAKILGNFTQYPFSNGMFYKEGHNKIYKAITEINAAGTIADLLTVTQQLEQNGDLEVIGGLSYLVEIMDSVPTVTNAEYYAEMVKELFQRRSLIYSSAEIYNNGFDSSISLTDMLSKAKENIFAIQESTTIKESSIKEELKAINESLQRGGLMGIPTGFPGLDEITCGYQNGEFYIIGGRPGVGKTAFALDLIINLCTIGKRTMLVSIEMATRQILARMRSKVAQVPYRCFRVNYELAEQSWRDIMIASSAINNYPLLINDAPNASMDMIVAKIENEYYQNGIEIVFIDHFHLIPITGFKNELEAYSVFSRTLKGLARRLNIPVVCLAQLNRGSEHRQNSRPVLSDLRGSGTLEQDADHVWFPYDPNTYDNGRKPSIIEMELIIAKNKSLSQGIINLRFKGAYMQFVEGESRHLGD